MCACYLKIRGKEFDVTGFLAHSPWAASASVSLKGTSSRPHQQPRDFSALRITLVEEDYGSISDQISACRQFINDHRNEFERLKGMPEATHKWFSLAYYLPAGEVLAISPHFDLGFISDLHSAGVEFDFSVFLCPP